MLIDDYRAQVNADEMMSAALIPGGLAGETQRATALAQRFVLSPLTAQTCTDLADPAAIERSRDHIFAPAVTTWLEWRGHTPGFAESSSRHGLLVDGRGGMGHGAIIVGTTTYVFDTEVFGIKRLGVLSFAHDFQADDQDILTRSEFTDMAAAFPAVGAPLDGLDLPRMGAFLAAAFALIATPRLTELVEHDMAKLNRAREAKGIPPLLSWREVAIKIDDGSVKTPNQTGGKGVSMHHVRSHLRLRLGKVELVRPHWRGDPRLGVILHRHKVVRAEDEPGEWQGGPLPPPSLIDDMKEDE